MVRSKHHFRMVREGRATPIVDLTGAIAHRGIGCVSGEKCPHPPLPDAPVQLCGKHIREVYEYAQDVIAHRWDSAVREYVTDLHEKFAPAPRAVTRRPKQGYVYFIRFRDRVKIGYSENPPRRFVNIPHEEVLGIVPGTLADEKAWHKLLAPYREIGEWFRAEPEVLTKIAQVLDRTG